ncbi:MAG: GNAT family N-acetyltransferase [Deltaproteobacteria bacterium]|nr:GNAT family N-acetyltransferase [Deltaproteobacteria bacterium]
MSISQLDKLFNPQVIAVAGTPGESPKNDPGCRILYQNLKETARPRSIYIIDPTGKEEDPAFNCRLNLHGVEEHIDLLILTCPLPHLPDYFIPEILEKTSIVAITRNISSTSDREILENISRAALQHDTRIIGVNSCGILNPPIQLNLSTHPQLPRAGKIAFFSQSGAVLGTILNLAAELDIGFSHVAGIGSLLDIKFGDLIDYVGDDPEVEAILLYLENIRDVKRFISACRSVSRIKPIIAIKSGRHPRIHEVLRRRVFSQIGSGPVYDSAFRRAGIISVDNFKELLLAGRSLSRRNIPTGDRLGIITNSGGLAIFTTDHLLFNQIEPTPMSKQLVDTLRRMLPHKLIQNPIDVGGGTDTETFARVVKTCLEANEFDALLILAAAHPDLKPRRLITSIQEELKHHNCAVTYAWINATPKERRTASALAHQGIYVYFSVPAALSAYLYSRRYRHKLRQLTALTPRFQRQFKIKHLSKRDFLEPFLDEQPRILPAEPAEKLLSAYGLTAEDSPPAGNGEHLRLHIGAATDVEFGPYLFLALDGIAAEVQPEKSIMLPPLNPFLAQIMITRSAAARPLKHRGDELREELAIILLRLASIITDCPEIRTLDISLREAQDGNYFLICQSRVSVIRNKLRPPRHLVIAPYPNEYEFHDHLRDGRPLLIRPIRPEDEDLHHELFHSLSRETNYFRFFSYRRHLTHEQAARFTQIDYDREMAIIALVEENGRQRSIGVNRLTYQPRFDKYEFAIVVADDYQGQGVGAILMKRLLEIARDRKIPRIYGVVLAENQKMIEFCQRFGFVVDSQESNTITFRLDLDP